jgi:hypothetical protein
MHDDKELRHPRLGLWIMNLGFWPYVVALVLFMGWALINGYAMVVVP